MPSLLNLSCPLLLLPVEGTGVRLPGNATRTLAAPLLCDSVQTSCGPRLSGAVSFHTLSPRDVSLFGQGGSSMDALQMGKAGSCLPSSPSAWRQPPTRQQILEDSSSRSICLPSVRASAPIKMPRVLDPERGLLLPHLSASSPCSWDALPWDFVNSSPVLVPEGLLRGLEFLAGVVFSPGNPAIP